MPAQTNNENILQGINQTIQALLDLAGQLTGGGGETTVNVAAPVVNITNNCNCSCGGGGSTPPQEPGEEGGTPPPGTGEPDPIESRKCKVANLLVQELIAYTDNMAALGLFNWSLDYATLGGILNSLAGGFTSGLLKLTFQVGGWLSNLQNLIFSGGFGQSIPATLSANEEAMVCALYNATNVSEAKSAVVAASGLGTIDSAYLESVLTTEALNMLFFSLPGSEEIINSFQGGNNCDCLEGCDTLIGQHSASARQIFTSPDRWGVWALTETGADFPEMENLGCHFGFKDNRVTVSGYTGYGTYFNVQYKVFGGQTYDVYISDINNHVFDQMYSEFGVYQSLTPFTLSFEVDRTQASA